ncbi:MAG: hypothetical protein IPK75_20375 [Acidobacteria bacterium]|nr:hypothetical protein [Acidobacteriota bacterium]
MTDKVSIAIIVATVTIALIVAIMNAVKRSRTPAPEPSEHPFFAAAAPLNWPTADFFKHLQTVPAEAFTRHLVYIYRLAPPIVPTPGAPRYIQKLFGPTTQADIEHQFGSGIYRVILANMGAEPGKQSVAQCTLEIPAEGPATRAVAPDRRATDPGFNFPVEPARLQTARESWRHAELVTFATFRKMMAEPAAPFMVHVYLLEPASFNAGQGPPQFAPRYLGTRAAFDSYQIAEAFGPALYEAFLEFPPSTELPTIRCEFFANRRDDGPHFPIGSARETGNL